MRDTRRWCGSPGAAPPGQAPAHRRSPARSPPPASPPGLPGSQGGAPPPPGKAAPGASLGGSRTGTPGSETQVSSITWRSPNNPGIWASSPGRARPPPDSPAMSGQRLRQAAGPVSPPCHLRKGTSGSHSQRRARQVGNRPHRAPGKQRQGPWAPRLLEAAVPAEDSAPLLQEPPARPRLRHAERLRGREPRSLPPATATGTGTAPPASPGSPEQSRAAQGASMPQPS
ncbi:basic salivary proline-rich protein 1-like [Molothrus ater]|uniref:basic salivary proline-rich protein 1-like n=1 Tax=Molothrus ater TaxID=84834 RepID=UPI00174C632C|nr:basic salivary proline-rich protein 1-like [Molothrus ater]